MTSRLTILGMTLLVEGGLAVLAIGLGAWLGPSALATLEARPEGVAWGFAAAIPLGLAFLASRRWPLGGLKRINEFLDQDVALWFRDCTVLDLAIISTLAGVGEELFFRGFLQGAIGERLGPAAGLILASLAFGLAHTITPTYFAAASVVGLYLGGLWIGTGNLLAPIVTHAVYDFFALTLIIRHSRTNLLVGVDDLGACGGQGGSYHGVVADPPDHREGPAT